MSDGLILLVEDNADDEALVLRALKRAGIHDDVVVVRDGAEALDYLFGTGPYAGRDVNVMPAVILLDLELPRIGGLEVLRRLRLHERTKFVPTVIFTSSTEARELIDGYALGANSYVRKPVHFERLADVIRQVGHYWVSVNECPPAR